MVRRIVGSALALVASVGLSIVAASPASAATNSFATPSGTGCLDGYNNRPGSEVYTTGCNGGNFQRFNYLGFNRRTQLASAGVAGHCIQSVASAVKLEPCRSGTGTQFWLVQGRPGSLVIRSDANPRVCLNRAGANVDVGPCDLGVAAWVLR
ncbi:hypothetical protein DMC61_33690 [Amycolatopsis sp. WAC 04169]|uniref:ricin-type beta-trefoil lectin domain protein n=1 Tax=Amycolatopsis sp. WAC 04169 TaxID=2203197 RepID=UPI000F7A5E76|nr:ricin-type beta-trefoil lectin domain protein [Amycolatopsis sp. WAC 04169]RSN22415.1 hypothetical protein DMC61_33690 [Amycolatopsis sp. WAC 04169]